MMRIVFALFAIFLAVVAADDNAHNQLRGKRVESSQEDLLVQEQTEHEQDAKAGSTIYEISGEDTDTDKTHRTLEGDHIEKLVQGTPTEDQNEALTARKARSERRANRDSTRGLTPKTKKSASDAPAEDADVKRRLVPEFRRQNATIGQDFAKPKLQRQNAFNDGSAVKPTLRRQDATVGRAGSGQPKLQRQNATVGRDGNGKPKLVRQNATVGRAGSSTPNIERAGQPKLQRQNAFSGPRSASTGNTGGPPPKLIRQGAFNHGNGGGGGRTTPRLKRQGATVSQSSVGGRERPTLKRQDATVGKGDGVGKKPMLKRQNATVGDDQRKKEKEKRQEKKEKEEKEKAEKVDKEDEEEEDEGGEIGSEWSGCPDDCTGGRRLLSKVLNVIW
jgi:hypothetical protein